jgi:hypothetical protein
LGGRDLGVAAALLSAVVPLQTMPLVGSIAVVVSIVVGPFGDPTVGQTRYTGLLPIVFALAVIGLSGAAWGGMALAEVFPAAGWWSVAAVLAAIGATRMLPTGAAGLVWFIVPLCFGPVLDPTPDRRGFVLDGDLADVDLPAGTGAPYVLDIGLDVGGDLAPGTAVAWFRVGDRTHRLLAADHAVRRDGAEADGGSSIVRRPQGLGSDGSWRRAARSVFEVPAGVVPRLTRHPDLPEDVTVVLETEGPALPTPPRNRGLGWWLAAAAVAVTVLQTLSGGWRRSAAVVPWAILTAGGLVARAWIEPLRLMGERLAVDLVLAALIAAWLPAAVLWLRRRRTAAAVAALVLPLALATPHLTPPLYGDEPFHLAVMSSLISDRDLDLRDNIDPVRHPGDAFFQRDEDLLHSPVLGFLLLPGFAVAGRAGALVLLALMGSMTVALVARRARRLGVPEARLGGLVLVLSLTYPLAVFACQIWAELIGALAVAGILVAAMGGRGARWLAALLALAAAAVKTRLALLAFPPALAVWWGRRGGRATGLVVLVAAAASSLAVGWVTMGHPFGIYRRLEDLAPSDPGLAARVLGGLAFDPSGGLLFSAPLWLVALVGAAALWRRGGPGERLLLVGCGLTVVALLHSLEWYGGGSPPARYLVPMLPAFALAGGMLLREPRRWRRLAELALAPSIALWWVLVTRPHHSINPGDGGWWATDALARSFLVDTAWLVPSFLVPRTATWLVPVLVVLIVSALAALSRWQSTLVRRLAAGGMAMWLLAAAGLVAAIELRTDRVVEAEAPQVRRHGGQPHPRPGTVSRFTHRRGWTLRDGQAVTVPLHLPDRAQVVLEGWLLGTAKGGAEVEIRWDDGEPRRLAVRGEGRDGRLRVPNVPAAGRHRLTMTMHSGPHGAVVLDRVVVGRGR